MASPFAGVAAAREAVFGEDVVWTSAGGAPVTIKGIFREAAARLASEDGAEVLANIPTLRVRRPAADAIATGDTIDAPNSRQYRVAARHPSGSPAADAFVEFHLEALT